MTLLNIDLEFCKYYAVILFYEAGRHSIIIIYFWPTK